MASPTLQSSLSQQAFKEFKRRPWRVVVVDRTALKRKVVRAAPLWAAAITLAEELRKLPDARIGIVFPPSAAAWIANLAVSLAGKSSVNLNFIASKETSLRSLEIGGVKTLISAEAVKTRFKDFPWENTALIDLGSFLSAPEHKKTIFKHLLEAVCLPAFVLEKIWKLRWPALKDEATLLFSSGSTGTPKGIPLTHENILTNLAQIDVIKFLPDGIKLLAALPIFHSMGFTVQYAYSIAYPIHAITYPTPLEPAAIAQIVREERAEIMIGTASFYRLYMKCVDPEDFRSLHSIVSGAEKTPKGLHEAWHEKFGSTYYEGYGLTETSPVISVCLKNANRIGTVGRILPWLEARIVAPETREVISAHGTQGVLEVRGGSIFNGYLNDAKANAEVLHDGWFYTGDLASISADGYLTIEGRLRRFSKMAGEMVPHGAIEDAIQHALGRTQENPAELVVTGVSDEKKGESLLILSEEPLNLETLRTQLQQQGLPNLWIPKKAIIIDKVPRLPSGKLDLHAIGKIARELAAGAS